MRVATPEPEPVGPGQESVWAYPRSPRLERTTKELRVVLAGTDVAVTRHGYRVLETSHPPNYYFPADDVALGALARTPRTSFCEFKGSAHYYSVRIGDHVERDAAWCYDDPTSGYELLAGCVAFYAGRMDACFVDGELVVAQPGGFYGGWITRDVVGPFKGEPGTRGW